MALDLSSTISLANLANPEVAAALGDLQGNIIRGHGRDHTANVFLQFQSAAAGNELVRSLVPQLTSARDQVDQAAAFRATGADGGLFTILLLSASGYRALGIDDDRLPLDSQFRAGMAASQATLADPPRAAWEPDFQPQPHALVVLAHTSAAEVAAAVTVLRANLPAGVTVVADERGAGQRNTAGNHIEHFGYVDGRSQPLVVSEDVAAEPATLFDASAPLGQFIERDPAGATDNSFGSYFVFRKLEQNVAGFKAREQSLAQELGIGRELAGALAVGRFEDGTPLDVSTVPTGDVSNDFNFSGNATTVPVHAHIRKTNPRSDLGSFSMQPQMLRRGITYGTRTDDPNNPGVDPTERPSGGVGLLFMAYQQSIAAQFEFMQQSWANNVDFAQPQTGLDPVIGQGDGAGGQRWKNSAGNVVSSSFAGFVTLKGGEYFYQPSLSGLRSLTDAAPSGPVELSKALRLPTVVLASGDVGADVTIVQTFLAGFRAVHVRLGSSGTVPSDPGPIDGDYGPRTTTAVTQFQQRFGITADGIWGPATAAAAGAAAKFVDSVTNTVLRRGSSGARVRNVQQLIAGRVAVAARLAPGTPLTTADPGAIDGDFGPRTEAAVRTWQATVGAVVDGVWGPATAAVSRPFAWLAAPKP